MNGADRRCTFLIAGAAVTARLAGAETSISAIKLKQVQILYINHKMFAKYLIISLKTHVFIPLVVTISARQDLKLMLHAMAMRLLQHKMRSE